MDQKSDKSNDSASYVRSELKGLKVPELREIAREETGPGTWIAHAKKKELIDAIIEGRPPDSLEAEHKYMSSFSPNLKGLPVEDAQNLSHEFLLLVRRVVSRELQPLRERVRALEQRFDSLEIGRAHV